jgi:Transcription factor S-II (TFIIS), central domain
VKTIKIDTKGSPILPAVKNTVVKVVSKAGSTPLKAIAPKPPVKEVVVASNRSISAEHVPKKQSSTEATRLSVRNSLQEVFKAKTEECKDVKVSENELKGLATTIEEELYALFKDVGSKYKAKFRYKIHCLFIV